jgi:putative ABC transport system substrate-binding protein
MMRRREFIAGLGSTAAWPLAARAQQGDRMRRVGVLLSFLENDAEAQAALGDSLRQLGELGWVEGRNVHFDVRWGGIDVIERNWDRGCYGGLGEQRCWRNGGCSRRFQ